MLPPIGCCPTREDGLNFRRRHQERKLHMLTFWRDGLERQLAALNASINTLEGQMRRDRQPTEGSDRAPQAARAADPNPDTATA